uniref:Putative ribonuclease H n=1 Tax=viral metagenome TaxID=1070528 RepID=A0A6M3KWL3_9ZZZZ
MKVYCDSSTTEACFVINGSEPIVQPYPEPVTNNVGEYKAVILALEWIANNLPAKIDDIDVFTDSLLVVNQSLGLWKVSKKGKHLIPYRDMVIFFLTAFDATIDWVSREENPAGKVLEQRSKHVICKRN